MKNDLTVFRNISIYELLKKISIYIGKNSSLGTGVAGFELKIKEINDPALAEALEKSGVKIGDTVMLKADVLYDALGRSDNIDNDLDRTARGLKRAGRKEEAELFEGLVAAKDFELEKISNANNLEGEQNEDMQLEDGVFYINSSIARKIVCDVDVALEKIKELYRDENPEDERTL